MSELHPIVKALAPLVVALLMAGQMSGDPAKVRTRLEGNAIRKLHYLGAAQLAYEDANDYAEYGRFGTVLPLTILSQKDTRSTAIDNYSLAVWFASAHRSRYGCGDSTFTIIAVPVHSSAGLRTFAICDDQTVRIATDYSPNFQANGVAKECYWQDETWWPDPIEGDSPCSWEPVP
ncbi:MAG: hypothetical protein ABI743_10850 [bacterium]